MEPDTLKKQTCYRESVYILLFPSFSPSPSLPPFSLHCLGWQLLDCFTSRSPWRWLLRGKTQTHNLFLLTAIHCMFVSGCPCGQYCLDAQLKCESRGEDTTGQDKAWISTLAHRHHPNNLLGFLENKIQCNVNSLNINRRNLRVKSAFHTVTKVKIEPRWTEET